jgi:hypothetical protein
VRSVARFFAALAEADLIEAGLNEGAGRLALAALWSLFDAGWRRIRAAVSDRRKKRRGRTVARRRGTLCLPRCGLSMRPDRRGGRASSRPSPTIGTMALPDDPGDVYADSAYRGQVFAPAVAARGGRAKVVQTSVWGRPGDDALLRLKAWNWRVNRVRCRIEKIFGTWKRSYGLRRMRWRGIAKGALQVRLTATAYNLKRAMTILRDDSLNGRRAPIASVLDFAIEFKLSG